MLITDRSKAHVDRLRLLRAKGWENLSESQKAEYAEYAAKGAYNYTDLNRVESAVAELAALFGLSLTTKTNWTVWDKPTQSEMERYLSNVEVIRNRCMDVAVMPDLPDSMNGLTYEMANNIERVLATAFIVADSVVRCGDTYSGEVMFMAEQFEDRQSTYPNRYKITRADGSTEYVTLERADEPTVRGTPLNAATFNKIIETLYWVASKVKPMEEGGTGATDGATGLQNLLASGATVLSSYQYGDTLPDPGTPGRIFFVKVDE